MNFDLILAGAAIVDGAGNPRFKADLGIGGERIVAVGDLSTASARETIALEGLIVAPGFIDMHSHSDLEVATNRKNESKAAQGVTTDLVGQDGLSYVPATDAVLAQQLRLQLRGWNGDSDLIDWSWRTVSDYLGTLDLGMVTNAAYLVPHGNLRLCAMGTRSGSPSADELKTMCRLLADGMEQGAVGLSAGLTYAPGMYADNEELVALCRVVASYGGFYAPHHRNYGSQVMTAFQECIDIARKSGVALHLTHSHLSFECNKGRAPAFLAMIDAALADGVDITMDSYPYLAGATFLHSFLPSWVQDGGLEETLRRLRDVDVRSRLRALFSAESGKGSDGFHCEPVSWDQTVVSGVSDQRNEQFVGRSLQDIADVVGTDPTSAYCDLLASDELGASCVFAFGNEENVRMIMSHPVHMPASDGVLVGRRPHPRAWGTFARYLGVYVREEGILRLEDCVRKMTSLPAQRLGMFDKGLVRPGMVADLVSFDPQRVRDVATYDNPKRGPEGIELVIVNGKVVVRKGQLTQNRPGRAQRRRAATNSQ